MTRVLVVDDDATLLRALTINLRARRYEVEQAATGRAALRAAAAGVDVVVLDLGLPDLDGVDVVAGIRGWSQVPIIVLSARESQAAKVDALDAGADDYVTKPFGMDELLARLRATLRRSAAQGGGRGDAPVVTTDDFTIDLAARRVTKAARAGGAAEEVRLTPTEWHVLEVLVRAGGKLITGEQLLHEVWGYDFFGGTRTVDVHVRRLRAKLGPEHEALIGTVRNVGYKAVRPARGRTPVAEPDEADGAGSGSESQDIGDPLVDPLHTQ